MSKLIYILLFFSIVTNAQDQKLIVFFNPDSKYAENYEFSADTTKATFSIYYKDYVVEKNRQNEKSIYEKSYKEYERKKKDSKTIMLISPPKRKEFSKWFTCLNPPQIIQKCDLPNSISLEDYMSNKKFQNRDSILILFKVNEQKYLLWDGFHVAPK